MLHVLEGHGGIVSALAFSPNGSHLLASASADHTVRLWDPTAKASPLHREPNPEVMIEVILSSDGNRLVTRSQNRTVQLWDSATGAQLCNIALDYPHIIAFSPNSQELVSGSTDGSICIWDPVTGAALNKLSPPKCLPPFGRARFTELALSPDVRRLAVWNIYCPMWDDPEYRSHNTIRLYDYTTGARLHTLEGYICPSFAAKFSPDSGRFAAVLSDNTIRLWDTATGVILHTLIKDDTNLFLNLTFSPNSSRLASSSEDDWNGMSVQIWDLAAGELLYKLPGSPENLTFSADGNHLLYLQRDDGEAELWDLTTKDMLTTLDCHLDLHDAASSWYSQDKSQALYWLDSSGRWITRNNQKVVLLPPDQRAYVCAIGGKRLAIGRLSGGVMILEFK
ncbi:WD40-repeat-containing domain protein [Xylaria telfairii]|nr:WD40-repeat-containing domain protein [Xylaria telfairii]